MPLPPIWSRFGWTDSATSTPRRTPSKYFAISEVSPLVLPSVTASPSAISSEAASSGWIITEGLPSRACDDGVSLKEVLRNERDGLVASRNGCASSASSMTRQWSGKPRHRVDVAHLQAERRMRPIGLEVEFPVGMGKAVEIMRGAEVRLQVAPEIGLEPRDVAMAAELQAWRRSVRAASSRNRDG